ncbi:hypothetical protein RvY_15034-2 [Ramazzottius varieornatus]|nr:hypothetical protein RvY_15034-2 [Ramazzottius varieornatus]
MRPDSVLSSQIPNQDYGFSSCRLVGQDRGPRMPVVFVYGTLKRGEPNHHVLVDPTSTTENQPVFIGEGRTIQPFPLLIASKYNLPYALDSPGTGQRIRGEIWDVNDECLRRLDNLEKHPDYYIRRSVEIELSISDVPKEILVCWMYLLHDFHENLLALPHLEHYSSSGPHGLVYLPRESRDVENEEAIKREVKKFVEKPTSS